MLLKTDGENHWNKLPGEMLDSPIFNLSLLGLCALMEDTVQSNARYYWTKRIQFYGLNSYQSSNLCSPLQEKGSKWDTEMG